MQNLFIKIRCFMKTIIFQLLSCLYLYDSGMLGPVCIRKQMLYTVFWRLAVIHRAAGIPTSGACGNIPCRRYTAFWRRREVCAKSVYRLLASKGVTATYVASKEVLLTIEILWQLHRILRIWNATGSRTLPLFRKVTLNRFTCRPLSADIVAHQARMTRRAF